MAQRISADCTRHVGDVDVRSHRMVESRRIARRISANCTLDVGELDMGSRVDRSLSPSVGAAFDAAAAALRQMGRPVLIGDLSRLLRSSSENWTRSRQIGHMLAANCTHDLGEIYT